MKNLFSIAEYCLRHTDIDDKLAKTHEAWALFNQNQLSQQSDSAILPIDMVLFPDKPQLLRPKDMPRRRTDSAQGLIAMFHALAHIEFTAIYLAWDILYRFRGLPDAFYADWLRIAEEEAQHFEMLRAHMQTLGGNYGDLPAHSGLWQRAEHTAHDLLARLAVVPRCLEAHGLDVTPGMIEKFKHLGDERSAEVLTRIYEDEIGHVQIGNRWFHYVCNQRGLEPEQTYQTLVTAYYPGKPKGPFNREARIIAGFSNAELNWLEEEA